jgi:hypothetical protein
VQSKTVSITDEKRCRYLTYIEQWRSAGPVHALGKAQALHGRLQHITYIIPQGQAYLTSLQSFMGLYSSIRNHAEKRMHLPQGTDCDLKWWQACLEVGPIVRQLIGPPTFCDVGACSDTSLGIGISVFIHGWWRAWHLLPGWKRGECNIQWAKALGFEFLCRYELPCAPSGTHIIAWGDNRSIVEGWWRGRSANTPVNNIFKRLGAFLNDISCNVTARYVASAHNPADKPSRGIYGPSTAFPFSRLLAPPAPPAELDGLVADFNAPKTDVERCAWARRPDQPRGKHIRSDKQVRRARTADIGPNPEDVGDLDCDRDR